MGDAVISAVTWDRRPFLFGVQKLRKARSVVRSDDREQRRAGLGEGQYHWPFMKRILLGAVCVASIACVTSIAGCSGSGSSSGMPQSIADGWPAKWCQAEPGNTKEKLVALMGPPTVATAGGMTWSAHRYQFNAFFDSDGTVRQLDINNYSLSAAEKAALACASVRTRRSVAAAARAAAAPAGPSRQSPGACSLVTGAEMSTILGAPVVAEANERPGKTRCIYTPASGISPSVDLSVDWGDGKAAMTATGMMERREPGLTSPYDGIGDQAAVIGPALMIRTGEDLVTIVFTGVTDAPAKAKHIFETAKPRM